MTPLFLVLLFLFILCWCFLVRWFSSVWKNVKYGYVNMILQILTVFFISLFLTSLRLYVISHVFCLFSFLYWNVSSGEVVTHSRPSSPWIEDSREMDVLMESWTSSAAEEAAPSVQSTPAEIDLFQRIRDLEAELAHGIPAQLNQGDYERQVREILANSVNPNHYSSNLSNELFEVDIMQKKVQIQNSIFNAILNEPNIDYIIKISPYPNIREEIYYFLEEKVEPLNSMRHPFQKHLMEGTLNLFIRDLEQNGRGSFLYGEFLSHFKDEKLRLLLGLPV